MTFQDSIKTCLGKKYACFRGRASRSEYWFFTLFTSLVNLVVGALVPLLSSVASLILLIPGIAVSVRRLHDSGLSGWWFLAPLLSIVCFGGIAILSANESLLAVGTLIAIVLGFYLFLRGSEPHENRFGFPESFAQEKKEEAEKAESPRFGSKDVAHVFGSGERKTDSDLFESKQSKITLEKTKTCPECGRKQSSAAKFCSECGASLSSHTQSL